VIIAIYVENTVVAAKSNERLQRQRRLNDRERLAVMTTMLVEAMVTAQSEVKLRDKSKRNSIVQAIRNSLASSGSLTSSDPDAEDSAESGQASNESMKSDKFFIREAIQVSISPEVFREVIKTEEVQHLLDGLDIAPEDRDDLFEILDADGNGELQIGEIIKGIRKLRGDARRSDVIAVTLAVNSVSERVQILQKTVLEEIKAQQKLSGDYAKLLDSKMNKLGRRVEKFERDLKQPAWRDHV